MTQMIFRRKSLERIASPDQLDRYLQVSAPSLWLILLALFLMLGAAAAWCFWGHNFWNRRPIGNRGGMLCRG